jgi:hypothetical protein
LPVVVDVAVFLFPPLRNSWRDGNVLVLFFLVLFYLMPCTFFGRDVIHSFIHSFMLGPWEQEEARKMGSRLGAAAPSLFLLDDERYCGILLCVSLVFFRYGILCIFFACF